MRTVSRRFPAAALLALTVGFLPSLTAQSQPTFELLRRAVPLAAGEPVALADLDGDADLDAVFRSEEGELRMLVNDGHALFRQGATLADEVSAAAVADLDGDGAADLAAALPLDLAFLWSDGAGGFTRTEVSLAALGFALPARVLRLADIDRDGDVDVLVLLGSLPRTLVLLRNAGARSFDPPQVLTDLACVSCALELGDLDGDGAAELVVLGQNGSTRSLLVYPNLGDGTLAAPGPSLAPVASPLLSLLLTLGDVDGDGARDLVYLDDRPHLLRNQGGLAFGEVPGAFPSPDPFGIDLRLADVTADGAPDVLLGVGLLVNDGTGRFQQASRRLPPFAFTGLAGDLDGDADVDLFGGTQLVLQGPDGLFHDPDASAAPPGPLASAPSPERLLGGGRVELVDLDGDGDLDAGGLVNDGRGVFSPLDGAVPAGFQNRGPRFGDLDGDGDADALVPRAYPYVTLSDRDALLVNDGGGRFQEAPLACLPTALVDPELSMDLAFGDVDTDGDLDAFVVRLLPGFGCHQGPCYSGAPSRLWLNDGTGCFTDAALPAVAVPGAFGVDLGDLDADGDLDALTSTGTLYENLGGGIFADASADFPHAAFAQTVALGDVDGDGDLDGVFSAARIALNDGMGRFPDLALGPWETLFAGNRAHLWVGDLDHDGRADLVEGIELQGRFVFPIQRSLQPFRGAGDGSFTPLAFPASLASTFDVGDVDGDGDPDVFDGQFVYANQERSLAWRAPARIGHPFVLDVAGDPAAPYLLLASGALRTPQPTPFGLLHLDLSALRFVRSGTLDATGRASLRADLPPDPALLGATTFWQAAVGSPARLTAFELVRIAGF